MSRGLQANSLTSKICAVLPATIAQIYAALPDYARPNISNAIGHATTRGYIERHGFVYRRTEPVQAPKVLTLDAEDSDTVLGHGASAHVTHRSDPSQSPRVFCPAFGPRPLSTCLDDYATAASGHKDGRVACTRCQYGQERRAALARGAA
jgi:hypothetical protein